MARLPTGSDFKDKAKLLVRQARTADDVRSGLAVVLPLEYGLSLEQVAELLGRSPSWVAHRRREFIAGALPKKKLPVSAKRGGRRRQLLSEAEERAFMESVSSDYIALQRRLLSGQVPLGHTDRRLLRMALAVYGRMALEKQIQRSVSTSAMYSIMGRVGAWKFGNPSSRAWTDYCWKLIHKL